MKERALPPLYSPKALPPAPSTGRAPHETAIRCRRLERARGLRKRLARRRWLRRRLDLRTDGLLLAAIAALVALAA